MDYPRRIIKLGETDSLIMTAVRARLRALQFELSAKGAFDEAFAAQLRLFQIRNVDQFGRNLVADSKIGPLTWGALFDIAPKTNRTIPKGLLTDAIAAARSQVGVREHPRNSNRGTEVEMYLLAVDCPPGSAWCAAFVYWCLQEASGQLGVANPCVRSGGVLRQWEGAHANGGLRINARDAKADPGLIQPGMVFVIDSGGGYGHTGFVTSVRGAMLDTIEGNTDASKTREGGGVYVLTRKVNEINKGYIIYA